MSQSSVVETPQRRAVWGLQSVRLSWLVGQPRSRNPKAAMPDETRDPRLTPARPEIADIRLRDTVRAARYVEGVRRRVAVPCAPLLRAPRADGALDTEAVLGAALTAYEAEADWTLVQLEADGYCGYMPRAALGPAEPAPTHRVTALRTFLYPAPDLKRPVLGHLSLGALIAAEGREGDYLRLASGAYVFAGHVADPEAHEPDHAACAERLIGTPYLWGGRSSLGLDCSGLVQLSLFMAGRPCPRDADMQERGLGAPLPRDLDGLRRGDLVFWKGHVGLMLDGMRLIHANGHHMAVAVEPLREAVARIETNSFGAVTALRRLAA